MDSSKQSNKISDIVKLKRMLKKWRIQASSASATVSSGDDRGDNMSNNGLKKVPLSRSDSNNNLIKDNNDNNNNNNNNNSDDNNSSSSSNKKNSSAKKGFLSRSNSNNNIFNKDNNNSSNNNAKKGSLSRSNSIKGIKFLKRTLSFTDLSTSTVSSSAVPKGFLAVHVGEEMKRFVIPTNYLKHQAFCLLLKEAEDEFGFQQEGILRIPCEVEAFENILRRVEAKNSPYGKQSLKYSRNDGIVCGSIESQSLSKSHHPPSPMCR